MKLFQLEEFEQVVGDNHRLLNPELSRSSEHSEGAEVIFFFSIYHCIKGTLQSVAVFFFKFETQIPEFCLVYFGF